MTDRVDIFGEGQQARRDGRPRTDNPYPATAKGEDWLRGWDHIDRAMRKLTHILDRSQS